MCGTPFWGRTCDSPTNLFRNCSSLGTGQDEVNKIPKEKSGISDTAQTGTKTTWVFSGDASPWLSERTRFGVSGLVGAGEGDSRKHSDAISW